MTPEALAWLAALVAKLRYLDKWAGVAPYVRDEKQPYVEAEWLAVGGERR